MKLLDNLRAWKLRVFPDWMWDVLVGATCGALGLLTTSNWMVLVLPIMVTVWNQLYNKVFEPKDAVLRMVVPVAIYSVIYF